MATRVFITGATSFTGCHIARAFANRGCKVIATLTQAKESYQSPVVKARMQHAKADLWLDQMHFGSENFLEALKEHEIDIFINHGASIKGYREPDFDYLESVRHGLHQAEKVVEILKDTGCKRFIHSGSIFEPDEGMRGNESEAAGLPQSTQAMSLYGVSKKMVWEALRYLCFRHNLGLTKIVIPNPVGPFENSDRLVPVFVKMWNEGKAPVLKTPQLIRDNLPAPWLGELYAREAEGALAGENAKGISQQRILRPSGYAMSNEAFVRLLVAHLKNAGYKKDCPLRIEATESVEPIKHVNTQPCPELQSPQKEEEFWKGWTEWLVRSL